MKTQHELRQAKWRAHALLLLALSGFVWTSLLAPTAWVAFFKAVSEAALVGALADLFAVSALFRSIPIPWIGRHTAVIPRNKDRIGENLALFVREKFLSKDTLLNLIRQHDPVNMVASWLHRPEHAQKISRILMSTLERMLAIGDDQHIQQFMRQAADTLIDKFDLPEHSAWVLEQLIKDGRHQELLDVCIEQVNLHLQEENTRRLIALQLARWLKQEYKLLDKLKLAGVLGHKLSDKLADILETMLSEIAQSNNHDMRHYLDTAFNRVIEHLRHDPSWKNTLNTLKEQLKQEKALNSYLASLWDSARLWLGEQLQRQESELGKNIEQACVWTANQILQDPLLQGALRHQLENTAAALAPEFATFLSKHIKDTVTGWDAQDLSEQIEQNIGKDLQTIRISGTIVGGALGGVLYALSLFGQHIQTLW